MNKKQRYLLIAVAIAIAATFSCAPYHLIAQGYVIDMGYRWVWINYDRVTIDIPLLLVEWVAICLTGGIAYALFADTQK